MPDRPSAIGPNAIRQLSDTVRAVREMRKGERPHRRKWPLPPPSGKGSPPFFIRIDAPQASLSANRNSYQWTEMEPLADGLYGVKDGGRDHTTHGLAFNDREIGNTATRVNRRDLTLISDDVDVTVHDASYQSPTVQAVLIPFGGGTFEVRFALDLVIDEVCSEPEEET